MGMTCLVLMVWWCGFSQKKNDSNFVRKSYFMKAVMKYFFTNKTTTILNPSLNTFQSIAVPQILTNGHK